MTLDQEGKEVPIEKTGKLVAALWVPDKLSLENSRFVGISIRKNEMYKEMEILGICSK